MTASPNDRYFQDNQISSNSISGEETLRLIAKLPAPQGLVARVRDGLRDAPPTARVLKWPLRAAGGWMRSTMVRGTAAAAIVCVVAGGGWRIYSRVQPAATARVLVMPSRGTPRGGVFSSAGATHLPDTLDGPVLKHPVPAPADERIGAAASSVSPPSPAKGAAKKKTRSQAVVAPIP